MKPKPVVHTPTKRYFDAYYAMSKWYWKHWSIAD